MSTATGDPTSRGWRHPHLAGIVRVWSSAADSPRLVRPTDVLLLIVSVVLTIAFTLAAPGPTALDTAITDALATTSSAADFLWGVGYNLLFLWCIVVLLLSLASRRRGVLLLDFLLAAAFATGAGLLASSVAGTSPATVLGALDPESPSPVYLPLQVAVAIAVIVTASPQLSRPLRYVGRALVIVTATACIPLGVAYPIGVLAAVTVGIAAAALTHLLRGTPQGKLTAEQVERALDDLNVIATPVSTSPVQLPGEELLLARRPDGDQVQVKIYGRDAWDSQVVGSTWTALTRRGESPQLGQRRRDRVEHEALLTMLAERAGVSVLPVITAGTSSHGDALLVTAAPGPSLADLSTDQVTAEMLADIWRSMVTLHDVEIAHRRIDRHHVVLRADGTIALADFAAAMVAADRGTLMADRARLLVATALAAGPMRSSQSALLALGADGLAEVLPYLQPAVLDRQSRNALQELDWSLDGLRDACVTAAGVEPPPLEQLRRVTWKSVGIVAIVALMAYFLASTLAGVDLASVMETLSGANFALLALALVLSPLIQTMMAVSTMGSSLAALRYVPVLMLQYSIQFIALCLPSTAARLALEVRFFQRFGVPAAAAMSIGLIDSVSGFAVQIALILLIVLSGLPGLTSSLGGSSTDTSTTTDSGTSLIVVVAVVGVVTLVVTLVVPSLRRRLLGTFPKIKDAALEQSRSARETLGVFKRPGKVATILAGNLGSQVLQAVILGICLASFGQSAHLSQLILINTLVSLFGGLMPVPGSMGVAEAGYTAGLQAIGVPAPIAVSTAIAFRMVTFYLPPLWGSAAMRWMRRHEYL